MTVPAMRHVISITDLTSRITRIDLAWKAYPWRRHPGLSTFDTSPGYLLLLLIAFVVDSSPSAYTLVAAVSISFAISWPTGQRYLQQNSARLSAAVSGLCCAVATCGPLPLWPGPPALQLHGLSDEAMSQLVLVGRLALACGALLGLRRLVIAHFLSAGAGERRRFQRNRERLADSRAYTEILGGWSSKRRRAGTVLSILYRHRWCFVALAGGALLQLLLINAAARIFLERTPNAFTLASVILVGTSIGLWRMANTFYQPTSEEARDADRRHPVLILRSFNDDALTVSGDGVDYPAHRLAYPIYRHPNRHRLEEVLGHALRSWAPTVTVGDPREMFPSSGAAREYIRTGGAEPNSAADWRRVVEARMREAGCLIFIIADTESLRWEFETGAAIHGRDSLVFVFPPLPHIDMEARWNAFRKCAEVVLGVTLPAFPAEGPTKPLAAFFAGDELVWLDGEDQTGRSFMVAVRAAVVLARERCANIADADAFLRDNTWDLVLQREIRSPAR